MLGIAIGKAYVLKHAEIQMDQYLCGERWRENEWEKYYGDHGGGYLQNAAIQAARVLRGGTGFLAYFFGDRYSCYHLTSAEK